MVGLTIVTSVSSIIIYSFHFTFFLWTHGVGIIVTFPICWLEKQNLESWINCPDLFSEYVMNIFWTKPLVISQLWVASILPRRPFFCISYSLYSFAGAPMPWLAQWTDTFPYNPRGKLSKTRMLEGLVLRPYSLTYGWLLSYKIFKVVVKLKWDC